ncbi:MAG: FeoA domain-containing protein [archaeon]|nr:FeoA domain-containing protein [archaeon]
MKFADMKVGDVAVVSNVTGEGQLRKRILDLGITKGARVKLVRIAPLGDPVEIELRGYRLTLRKTEAVIVDLVKEESE